MTHEPPPQRPWPESVIPLGEAAGWLHAHLSTPLSPTPLVYTAYEDALDRRVTARFPGRTASGDVVFKADFFPLHQNSARAHALVARSCPGMVPEVLAWEGRREGSLLAYRAFDGDVVDGLHSLDTLCETARTLARIQVAVARIQVAVALTAQNASLPCIASRDIPRLFDAVLQTIRENERVWTGDTGALAQWLPFDRRDVLARLEELRPTVTSWSNEVEAGPWPLTIYHRDLHAGNALSRDGGVILIFDWDDAVLGCPFFSMERLLVSAWLLDSPGSGPGPWGYASGTPAQYPVAEAYLEALPWGSLPERRRALQLSVCLAVIQEMHLEITWAKLMGWQDANPEWTAQLVSRLFQHILRITEENNHA